MHDEPNRMMLVSRRTFDQWKSTKRSFERLAKIREWQFVMADSRGPSQDLD